MSHFLNAIARNTTAMGVSTTVDDDPSLWQMVHHERIAHPGSGPSQLGPWLPYVVLPLATAGAIFGLSCAAYRRYQRHGTSAGAPADIEMVQGPFLPRPPAV